MLEFRILGPLEVVGEDGPIPLGGPKQRATLAILLLAANRVVPVERLADDLYAGEPPVTAVTQVQRQISELRKALGSAAVIETRAPGYLIRLAPQQLDLNRFERRVADAGGALAQGEAQRAADLLQEALALWRGPPLADLAHEPFAQPAIARLEELRLGALEQRIDADLALGRHADLVGELEALVAEHPVRERLRAQLMLALYRAGRQAEALEVYRATRAALVEEFGLEPTAALQQLERAVLVQDPSLDIASRPAPAALEPDRIVLLVPSAEDRVQDLVRVARPLAGRAGWEMVVARLVASEDELGTAVAGLNALRGELDVPVRTAAFTSRAPAEDAIRLAGLHDAGLVLLDAPAGLDGQALPVDLAAILERSPTDVGILAGRSVAFGGGIFVPFAGSEHDWAALEVGAWVASAAGDSLRLVGTKEDPTRGRRDASRLLADAALAVQRVVGVASEPVLAEPTEDALVAAVESAALVVVGINDRWRGEGIGATRRALVGGARPPTLVVHRGPRPGGLAPRERRTRFTWSIDG